MIINLDERITTDPKKPKKPMSRKAMVETLEDLLQKVEHDLNYEKCFTLEENFIVLRQKQRRALRFAIAACKKCPIELLKGT